MLYFAIEFNYISTHLEQHVFLLTKYVLSAEEVGSLKHTVQSPLEFGWDVKEQRPGREGCHSIQYNTFLVFFFTFCKYDR